MAKGRVLVTGAGGLIGRTLCERLHAAGRPILATDVVPPDGQGPNSLLWL